MIKFRILGVNFSVSFLYICLISVFLIYDNSGIVIWSIFSSLFHESFHIIFLYIFSAKPKCICFELSGIKLIKSKELNFLQDIIVLISGCFGNMVLFFICCKFNMQVGAVVNLCLFVFNLLPSITLDGGQILFRIFEHFFNFHVCVKICFIISTCISIFLMIVGIIIIIYFQNPTIFLTGIMVMFSSYCGKF